MGIHDRFMEHVDCDGPLVVETPCWVWTGAVFRKGYGNFRAPSKLEVDDGHQISARCPHCDGQIGFPRHKWRNVSAHIWLYEYTVSEVPEGMYLCHRCDNSACVRPDHMFVGTQKQNLEDMTNKGRRGDCRNFGEKNAASKLTEVEVREIRHWVAEHGHPYGYLKMLSEQYGVSTVSIQNIVKGKTWQGVK